MAPRLPPGSDEEAVITASLLRNSAGALRDAFPKTYHVRVTWGFYIYLACLTIGLFAYSGLYYLPGTVSVDPMIFLFDAVYILCIMLMIFMQVPRRVIRERERLLIVFCCRTRQVPIDSIVEIRVTGERAQTGCSRRGMCCRYPLKCFWGYPTNFTSNIVVVTDTCCNNYAFSLHEMAEFMADNWPDEPETGVEMVPPPQVMGTGLDVHGAGGPPANDGASTSDSRV